MSFVDALNKPAPAATATTSLILPSKPPVIGSPSVGLDGITLWPTGMIPSVHVLPGKLDLEKLRWAVGEMGRCWPAIAGRFRREPSAVEGRANDYTIALTGSGIPFTHAIVPSTSAPFSSPSVIQPTLHDFVPSLAIGAQLNTDEPLFALKLTELEGAEGTTSVLGLAWGHILGDGASYARFTEVFSKVYATQEPVPSKDQPNFGPHVALDEHPSAESLRKWENYILEPTFPLSVAGGMYGSAIGDSEEVQFTLEDAEIKELVKAAKDGLEITDKDKWVTEQDILSSWVAALLEEQGEEITEFLNSVNYRSFFPKSDVFPPSLPLLCANTAQMFFSPCSGSGPHASSPLFARASNLRASLSSLRANESDAKEWLSCAGARMRKTCDDDEMQCMIHPKWKESGVFIVNSNYRYTWNFTFGFEEGTTQFHTAFSAPRFLRVFKPNHLALKKPGEGNGGAELTFRVVIGNGEKVRKAVEEDRATAFARWRKRT